ncbi:DUF885 domain-containing protein [Hyphococcus lacteus]|uniref:DUF885 domain-containing protein n=1 Tax=Hyphococcus lacteus TaxID=3143536 RepID=A0ABV3Z8V8_9PROT
MGVKMFGVTNLGKAIGVAVSAAAFSLSAYAAPADDLDALFDDYWSNEMEEFPFNATYSGVSGFERDVPSVAPADQARRRAEAEAFLARLNAINVNALDPDQQVSAQLLAFILKHDVALSVFDSWRIPFLADTGFHTDFGYIVGSTAFRTAKDYDDYLARLSAMPDYIDQNIENMRQGLRDGFTQPKEILPFIIPSFEGQVKDNPEDHPFYAPFTQFPANISASEQKALRAKGRAVVQSQIIPAYQKLLDFMTEEYVPGARDSLGAYDLPNGEAYYAALVRYYTTLDDATPEKIHKLGLKEVARIRKEMDAVIKQTGFKGSFKEFIEFLRTDEQFYAKTPEALLERAAWLSKDIDGRLPAYFGKLPRQPYSVEPVPEEIAANYTTGRYVGAPAGGDRGGQYWVNTYALDKRPLYALPALTLHEAVPGHHLQSALALELEDTPEFRKQFYPHAFGEGWGLYSEKLGVEMGIYQTPYDDFGRLSYEMWRACRLVIDTGIHAKGWTREQAIDYLASNTALSLHNVQTEVDRYIAWPGQALAYKMGELTLWELREKAEQELGDDFDIRAFHDAVLSGGGLPLEMLRVRIDQFIDDEK